jgi:hypothetical protein
MPFGGIPVVYDGGDGAAIVASVAQRTGLAPSDLHATPLDELLDADAVALGDGELRPCAGAPVPWSAVEAELARAEAARASKDKAGALDALEAAFTAMGCLTEVVAPEPAARAFLLRAALLAEQGDEEGARIEVRAALAFDPEASWPGGTMLDGEVLLEAERASKAVATLALAPPAGRDGPWIDGRAVASGATSIAVAPGVHLAQHALGGALHSGWLLVGEGAAFVVPAAFEGRLLDRMADPETRAQIEQLVLSGLDGAEAAYVVSGDWLWLVTVDAEGVLTIELDRPKVVAPAKAPAGKVRGRGKKKDQPK